MNQNQLFKEVCLRKDSVITERGHAQSQVMRHSSLIHLREMRSNQNQTRKPFTQEGPSANFRQKRPVPRPLQTHWGSVHPPGRSRCVQSAPFRPPSPPPPHRSYLHWPATHAWHAQQAQLARDPCPPTPAPALNTPPFCFSQAGPQTSPWGGGNKTRGVNAAHVHSGTTASPHPSACRTQWSLSWGTIWCRHKNKNKLPAKPRTSPFQTCGPGSQSVLVKGPPPLVTRASP